MDIQREDINWHLWNAQRTQQQIAYLEREHMRSVNYLGEHGMTQRQIGEYGVNFSDEECDLLDDIARRRRKTPNIPLF